MRIIETNHEANTTVLKNSQEGKLHKAKKDCPDQVHTDQMVLGAVKREAGCHERRPKVLKTKLAQDGHQKLKSTEIRWFS